MGAWIEINPTFNVEYEDSSRTPRWVRGLKSFLHIDVHRYLQSHPTMGAWIEIAENAIFITRVVSHPTMGAWIEIA